MAQWTNANRINGFLNATPLPLFCEISGAMLIALVGLTAGRLSDEIRVNLEIFEIHYRSKYLIFCFVLQRYNIVIVVTMRSRWIFRLKPVVR